MHSDITGVILAGGKSTRMGTDKALLPFGTSTMIGTVAEVMRSLFPVVLLSANAPDDYRSLDLPSISDILELRSPLAGIHAGLGAAETGKIFVLSCDMPLITPDIIEYIIGYPTARPITVARADGFVQQLCGVYSKCVLPLAEEIAAARKSAVVKDAKCPVLELVERTGGEIVDIESKYAGYVSGSFLNVNRPADLETLCERTTRRPA